VTTIINDVIHKNEKNIKILITCINRIDTGHVDDFTLVHQSDDKCVCWVGAYTKRRELQQLST